MINANSLALTLFFRPLCFLPVSASFFFWYRFVFQTLNAKVNKTLNRDSFMCMHLLFHLIHCLLFSSFDGQCESML